jgi:pimeloyl-ACP methyl ester carboxylesterase/ketosteroid isomerase-like protein
MSNANHDIVNGFYEAVRRGEFAAATEVFSDDLVWVEPPFPGHEGGVFQGKSNILTNVLGKFIETWSDLEAAPARITPTPEGAIVHGHYRGKHKDTLRPFEARFVHTWTINNGKATRFEMLADTVQFFRTVRPSGISEIPVVGKTIKINGVDIFYREAGPGGAPVLLLLHGFPSSSHMFRNLIPALADKFHVFAPDYPGFGLSGMPSTSEFTYTFDNLAKTILDWTDAVGIKDYTLYLQDYGGPVGFRVATARPAAVRGLVIQNGNAYMEGLSPNLAPLSAYMSNPTAETEQPVRGFLALQTTKFQYTHGTRHPDEIAPEAWIYDQYFLDRPGNDQIQLALFRDYKTNPPLYSAWQEYLRKHQPPTLVAWGKNDPFFTEAGAVAFKRDVPRASVHLLDTGHFALEDHCVEIAGLIREFLTAGTAVAK